MRRSYIGNFYVVEEYLSRDGKSQSVEADFGRKDMTGYEINASGRFAYR
ncbi:MAG: hypothetical protein J6K48_12340 [Lachnospiraceae bacterium]|nr:hypothetical protein [Lachnospiraceae bacterium]